MPFELTSTDGILCARFYGRLAFEDLQEAFAAVATIEAQAEVCPHRLVDLSSVNEVDIDYSSMQRAAAVRQQAPLKNHVKSAVVAPTPLLLGFARMFQALNDNPNIRLEIFPNAAAAWVWLAAAKPKISHENR